MKKVLMLGISGHSKDFLLSLPILKSYLEKFDDIKNKFDLQIKEYTPGITKEDILSDIESINPDILCFSCYVWNMELFNDVITKIKNKILILGGPEISLESIKSGKFDNLNVDYLVYGEGEMPLYLILKTLENPFIPKIGVVYKHDKKYYYNKNNFLNSIENDSAYLSGSVSSELLTKDNRFNLETQRGCNYCCSYCQYGKEFPFIRYRNPNLVVEEFKYLNSLGLKYGRVLDANFFSNKKHASIILNGLIDNNIKINLVLEGNSINIDNEMVKLCGKYVKLGNKLIISIGLQTTNKQSAFAVNRYHNLEKFNEVITKLTNVGVICRMDLILGLPYETKKSYLSGIEYLINLILESNAYVGLNILRVLYGTQMVKIAKENGYFMDKHNMVYMTSTMTDKEIMECLQINAIVYRIFNPIENDKDIKIRNLFHNLTKTFGILNTLELIKEKVKHLYPTNYYEMEDFYYKEFKTKLNNDEVMKILEEI